MVKLKFKNSALTTLSNSILAGDTSIGVANPTLLPSLAAGEYFYAVILNTITDYEIVKVTAVTGDTLTVLRGQDGTTAKPFASGKNIAARLTATQLSEILAELNSHSHAFSAITSKPITLAGYGITDAAPVAHTHAIDGKLFYLMHS